MPGDTFPHHVVLESVHELSWGPDRHGEPVTVGVPLPRGAAAEVARLTLRTPDGRPVPAQIRALDRWPDGSLRWALISFAAEASRGRARYALTIGHEQAAQVPEPLQILEDESGVRIVTGATSFEFTRAGVFPLSSVNPVSGGEGRRAALRVRIAGRTHEVTIRRVAVVDRGPLRAELEVRGAVAGLDAVSGTAARRSDSLEVTARVELFTGLPTAEIAITLRNTGRAVHPGGQWGLGDAGSILLDSAVVSIELGAAIERVRCAAEATGALAAEVLPLEIVQESSGGERWNCSAHRNREGRVPMRFRGYRLTSGTACRAGLRATPIVVAETNGPPVSVAVPQFWENFPRAITVHGTSIDVGLFPEQSADFHELQGGEQKTHRIVIAFDRDPVSVPPLAWVHDPLIVHVPPEWACESEAVPFLTPATGDEPGYAALVADALDAQSGLLAKRERADEYGWRHFGDLPADHESAFQPVDQPFVSHYNNQYDALAACAVHFLRTGDVRWWRLMTDLAAHVRDIDIYHTRHDKSAYNGGLFWHTAHYLDAGLSTHRTYPPGTSVGGGPSAEHNYNAGLMLHYFLTGDRASRDAAIGLGAWVLTMDDGRLTPFRWLAPGPTGLASLTRDYHGPGRGAGHSIQACLVAARLTSEPRYNAKADELIARCIHPQDNIDALELLDAERRWSYTAFLQVLGIYLHGKVERGENDATYAYGQACLLHYARWMAANERPYLDHPERLEYPTETWVAQELRKADVFFWAALHARPPERQQFLERAAFFFEYAVRTLSGFPERQFTRPLVLVLAHGVRLTWMLAHRERLPAAPAPASTDPWRPPVPFVPQRTTAVRRAVGIAAVSLAGLGLLAAMFWSG